MTIQESHGLGSPEGHDAMIRNLPEHFDMKLDRSQMRAVLYALHQLANESEFHLNPPYANIENHAVSLYCAIAVTLGVELF